MMVTGSLYLDSNEDIRLKESDCEESEESSDLIDNIPVNSDINVASDGTEWIPRYSKVPGGFATRNVLRQCRSNKLRET
ncbi:hypothetical protein TNCV_2511921 [Trichonephila clavipes]|nr:hypothetical protein TNCV_2511921 [Trichonephila clavipes]